MMNMKQAAAILIGGVLLGGVTCFWFTSMNENDYSFGGSVGYEEIPEETTAGMTTEKNYDFSEVYRKFCSSDFTYIIYEGSENPLQLTSGTDAFGEVTYGDCFVDENFFENGQTGYGIRIADSYRQQEKTENGCDLSEFYILENPTFSDWGEEVREGAMNYDLYQTVYQFSEEEPDTDEDRAGKVFVYFLCDVTDGTICQIILDFSGDPSGDQTSCFKVIDSISYRDDLEMR